MATKLLTRCLYAGSLSLLSASTWAASCADLYQLGSEQVEITAAETRANATVEQRFGPALSLAPHCRVAATLKPRPTSEIGMEVWETVQLHTLPMSARELKARYGADLTFFGGICTQRLPFVTPDDVQTIAHDVLRHRLILSFDAEAQGVSADDVVDLLIEQVAVP